MTSLRDHFIPHAGNDYAPHALQKTAALLMVLMILLTFAMANLQSLLWITSDWMVSTILPAILISETNDRRSEENLTPLTRSAVLDYAATLKADHMAKYSYFAHYSPTGVSPWHWFEVAGYDFIHAGENLAVHFKDSSQVVEAWMESPSHRANIMKAEYKEIGIGVAEGTYEGYDTVFVVQLFGTPVRAYLPPAPETANTDVATTTTSLLASPVAPTSTVASAETVVEPSARVSGEQLDVVTSSADTPDAIPPTLPEETFLATTTAPFAASVQGEEGDMEVSTAAKLATQPETVLQMIYLLLAGFVTVVLGLSIFVEIRHQQPVQIAYAVGLLIMMGGLWWLHTSLVGSVLIV